MKEQKFTYEGAINGHTFKQVVAAPPDDAGGTNMGGSDGANKGPVYIRRYIVVFGPVVEVLVERRDPKRKK